jgi:pre-mRNA-splicing factor ATP-dependent RNA helicase DHX38/PRP16
LIKDNEEWEESRMLSSGIASFKEVSTDFSEEENKVQVIVHQVKAPFLEGKASLTKQLDLVLPVVDAQCDLVKQARKGSALLLDIRNQQERMKAVKDKFKLSGTAYGQIVGKLKK